TFASRKRTSRLVHPLPLGRLAGSCRIIMDQAGGPMSIRVLKFGGTSLGSAEAIGHAAGRIAAVRDHGFTPIVVVSAMGHETDRLIDLAQTINPEINARELDF